MTILHLSDTHGQHRKLTELPQADIAVHSGDFTFAGSEEEAYDFIEWFCDLPCRHKLFISGNHDMCMYGAGSIEGLPEDVHYLCNSGIELEGVSFFGVPMFMEDVRAGRLTKMVAGIPADTQVLITHQPPFGIGDVWNGRHCGSKELQKKAEGLPLLKCHLFGHQHNAHSISICGSTTYSNAAVLDNRYHLVAHPPVIEINI